MSTLSSKEIANWHRAESKRYSDLAAFHRRTADTIDGVPAPESTTATARRETKDKELTLPELESALTVKAGRVNHVAARLQVSEDQIWNLLGRPECKFGVGNRGFIYPKSELSTA
jgi:hypothetical protein